MPQKQLLLLTVRTTKKSRIVNCGWGRAHLTIHRTIGLGTTVFRRTQNFEPSHGICPFLRNFCVFTEFCGIQYWPVIQGTNMAYFGGVQATVLYVHCVSKKGTPTLSTVTLERI